MMLWAFLLFGGLVVLLFSWCWRHHVHCLRHWEEERQEWQRVDERTHEWVASVSHSLRSPFNGILGIVDALRMPETIGDTKVRNELMDLIAISARQGVAIVEDLRCFEWRRSEGRVLDLRAQSLPPLIKLAIHANMEKARCKSQRLVPRIGLGTHAACVVCDESAMVQIFSHLIDCACACAPASSEIELHLRSVGDTMEVGVDFLGTGQKSSPLAALGFPLNVITSLTEAMGGSIHLEAQGAAISSRVWLRFPLSSRQKH